MSTEAQMALKDVKNRLSEVVDKVEREHDGVVLTKHGRPASVVVRLDDLESLEETLDMVRRPRLVSQIRDSLAELNRDEARGATLRDVLTQGPVAQVSWGPIWMVRVLPA